MELFKNKYWSIVWTILRVWLGYEWLMAGYGKVFGDHSSVWVGDKAGVAISGFLKGAVAKATGTHPAVESWYAGFIQNVALPNAKLFSYLVAYGELLVGIALIFGIFTTVALYAGAFMNLNYMLAGTTSTNPRMYTIAIILLFAGTSAYAIGIDRYLIPWLKERYNRPNTPPAT